MSRKALLGIRHRAHRIRTCPGGELPSQQYVRILRGLVGEGERLFEMKAHKGRVRSVAYPARNPSMVASAGPEMCAVLLGRHDPRHRESDTKIHRGRITKQGNHLVRWAVVEAVQRLYGGAIGRTRARLTERRGTNIAKVAAARKLLTLVYYALRHGHVRCLARPA